VRLGLFGGTFNPIHFGHLRAAEEVAEAFRLERLLFIPAARPPHKKALAVTPFAHRLAMLHLAVAEHPCFEISDIENQRTEKSYSIETLRIFRRQYGEAAQIYFIVGLDAMLEIDTWREYREIFTLCHFVVLDRPGSDPQELSQILCHKIGCLQEAPNLVFRHPSGNRIHFFPITRLDISSTLIRGLASHGLSLRFLLPEAVRRYILKNKLYT
jgi:nicotinate-nucleotide adenylyltransferase